MGILLAERGRFQVLIAENDREIRMAQQLRYDVFFRLRDGQAGDGPVSGEDALDTDRFDSQFRHILVMDREGGRVVGTYRFQSGAEAKRGLGFYSAVEYQLEGVAFDTDFFEVGRSCVAEDFRGGAVISLLWLGLTELQQREHYRHLFGCVSLPVSQLAEAWEIYDSQQQAGALDPVIRGVPQPGYRVGRPRENAVGGALPPLLKGYLRLGARIAGEPVLDVAFGTVDLLIHLDFYRMTDRYFRHYETSRKRGAA